MHARSFAANPDEPMSERTLGKPGREQGDGRGETDGLLRLPPLDERTQKSQTSRPRLTEEAKAQLRAELMQRLQYSIKPQGPEPAASPPTTAEGVAGNGGLVAGPAGPQQAPGAGGSPRPSGAAPAVGDPALAPAARPARQRRIIKGSLTGLAAALGIIGGFALATWVAELDGGTRASLRAWMPRLEWGPPAPRTIDVAVPLAPDPTQAVALREEIASLEQQKQAAEQAVLVMLNRTNELWRELAELEASRLRTADNLANDALAVARAASAPVPAPAPSGPPVPVPVAAPAPDGPGTPEAEGAALAPAAEQVEAMPTPAASVAEPASAPAAASPGPTPAATDQAGVAARTPTDGQSGTAAAPVAQSGTAAAPSTTSPDEATPAREALKQRLLELAARAEQLDRQIESMKRARSE